MTLNLIRNNRVKSPPPRSRGEGCFTPSSLRSGLVAFIIVAIGLTGCGYQTKELYPEQYHNVATPIFENRTFYREVEFDLAEAVAKQIEQRTPYKIGRPGTADTMLQGTIVGIEQSLIARRREGAVPEQMEITLTVDFEWKDLRTGQVLVSRRGFTTIGRYAPAREVGEPFEIAQHEAVERMAVEIVSAMREEW